MNDPQVTPEELKRRKAEKEKRYKAFMKSARPLGFVQTGSKATLLGPVSTEIDMDSYAGVITPKDIVNIAATLAYRRGFADAQRVMREAMGVLQ